MNEKRYFPGLQNPFKYDWAKLLQLLFGHTPWRIGKIRLASCLTGQRCCSTEN